MKRLLIAGAFLVSLWGSAALGASAPSEAQQIAQIESVTEAIRQLHHTHLVNVKLVNSSEFNAALRSIDLQFNPDSVIQVNQREGVLLGFLKKSDDLKKILLGGLVSRVEGFYDYQNKILYVRNTNGGALGPDRWAVAHEYNHALQDQNFDLSKLLPDQNPLAYRNSDMVLAHKALTEGDSIKVQTIFIYRTYSAQDLAALNKEQSQPSTGPALPKAVQRQFYFPYSDGVSFVEALYKPGGMKAVTAAYHRLPQSTYEIMHPAAYAQHWKPVDVTLHGVQGFTGWTQVDDDVMGAFGYNLMLWQYLGTKSANSVTNNYSGDRYIFLENGTQNAMLLDSVWSSPGAAVAARKAFVAALKKRYKHVSMLGGAALTATEADGAVYLTVAGRNLTIAYAPTAALATQLGTAQQT